MSLITIAEIVATITGIMCVVLQTKERISAWPLGIISVGISVIIFFQSKLYSDVILHVSYVFLNIYGWYNWSQLRKGDRSDVVITSLRKHQVILVAAAIILVSGIWGYTMKAFTNADLVYFDAFTTVGSLIAQFLLTRKIIENWILWIIVDVVAVNMYIFKELYLMAFLFFVYLVICIKGYKDWKKVMF